jgi:hypothetical protein
VDVEKGNCLYLAVDNNNNKNNNNNSRTTLNKFFTKNCHTRNITHHKESATS